MVKNRKFNQKSKIWSKIEILVNNWTFGQKLKFWSKIEILVQHLVKNWKFGQTFSQKLKVWSTIELLGKNWKFVQKSKKFVRNRNVGQIFVRFWRIIGHRNHPKIAYADKDRNFHQIRSQPNMGDNDIIVVHFIFTTLLIGLFGNQ